MTLATEISVGANGNIRRVGAMSRYHVEDLHYFLSGLGAAVSSSGDDIYDITYEQTASDRTYTTIISLLGAYNIDDDLAQYLYGGSVTQANGDTIYAAVAIQGTVATPTDFLIIQNNVVLTSFWGTGINADPTKSILSSQLIKVRSGGADIDGRRIRVKAAKYGDTYFYADATLDPGLNIVALFTQADDFNETVAGTVSTWTDIVLTAGYQAVDLNNGDGAQPYAGKWNIAARTLNQYHERAKWLLRHDTVSTILGLDARLFVGITHSLPYDTEAGGPFTQPETLTFANGATARLFAINDQGATGVMYVQLLTGVAPVNNNSITGGTSGATALVNGTPTAYTPNASTPFGSFSGTFTGAYGWAIDPATVAGADITSYTIRDLASVVRVPPNNVATSISNIVAGSSVLQAIRKDVSYTVAGVHSAGATTLTVSSAVDVETPPSGRLSVDGDVVSFSAYAGSAFTVLPLPSSLAGGEAVTSAFFDRHQFLAAAGNNSGNTTLVIQTSITSVVPAAGFIYIFDGVNYRRLQYASRAGSTFTLVGTLPVTFAANRQLWVPLISVSSSAGGTEQAIITYPGSPLPVLSHVKKGGPTDPRKPFVQLGEISATGLPTQAVQTPDA